MKLNIWFSVFAITMMLGLVEVKAQDSQEQTTTVSEETTGDLAPSLSEKKTIPAMSVTLTRVKNTAPAATHKVNVSRGRYQKVPGHAPLSVFRHRPYTGPECLEGLGRKSARELGWTGRRVYNEMLHGAEVVILSGDAIVYYDTASMEPVYLEGCFRSGRPYKNRLAFVPEERRVEAPPQTYVPTPQPKVCVRHGHWECRPVFAMKCFPIMRCVCICGHRRMVKVGEEWRQIQVGSRRMWVWDDESHGAYGGSMYARGQHFEDRGPRNEGESYRNDGTGYQAQSQLLAELGIGSD
jgi:hypothetical protein